MSDGCLLSVVSAWVRAWPGYRRRVTLGVTLRSPAPSRWEADCLPGRSHGRMTCLSNRTAGIKSRDVGDVFGWRGVGRRVLEGREAWSNIWA